MIKRFEHEQYMHPGFWSQVHENVHFVLNIIIEYD